MAGAETVSFDQPSGRIQEAKWGHDLATSFWGQLRGLQMPSDERAASWTRCILVALLVMRAWMLLPFARTGNMDAVAIPTHWYFVFCRCVSLLQKLCFQLGAAWVAHGPYIYIHIYMYIYI